MSFTDSSHRRLISSAILFVAITLSACSSTENQEPQMPECRAPDSEACKNDDDTDRGYDPCLINNKLPVCKT